MNKIVLFAFLVLTGTFGALILLNQGNSNNSTQSLFPSPTLSVLSNKTSTDAKVPNQEDAMKAIIKTNKGDIELVLYGKDAPNTVANFMKKADEKFYNNLTFHRVENWVIQGGDPKGDGTGGGTMPSELNNKPFARGSLGVARTPVDKMISNDSQFFITKTDSPYLNGDYTNFGIVTKGMDVVEKIQIGDQILSVSVE